MPSSVFELLPKRNLTLVFKNNVAYAVTVDNDLNVAAWDYCYTRNTVWIEIHGGFVNCNLLQLYAMIIADIRTRFPSIAHAYQPFPSSAQYQSIQIINSLHSSTTAPQLDIQFYSPAMPCMIYNLMITNRSHYMLNITPRDPKTGKRLGTYGEDVISWDHEVVMCLAELGHLVYELYHNFDLQMILASYMWNTKIRPDANVRSFLDIVYDMVKDERARQRQPSPPPPPHKYKAERMPKKERMPRFCPEEYEYPKRRPGAAVTAQELAGYPL